MNTAIVHLYGYRGQPWCGIGFLRRSWFRLFGFAAVGPTKCDLVTCPRCRNAFDLL